MSVTIASSSPARRLSRLDLPTLGWPARTTCRPPCSSSAPCRARSKTCSRRACRRSGRADWHRRHARESRSPRRENRVLPRPARSSISCSTQLAMTSRENSPCSERTALRAAAAVDASIRSMTALGLRQIELAVEVGAAVNSPGSARRAPSSRQRASSICMTTGPPWPCSSRTSSPVKECGAGK
jgi:hypothetical protein